MNNLQVVSYTLGDWRISALMLARRMPKARNTISFIFQILNLLLKNLRNKKMGNKGAIWGEMGQYINGHK